jgi:lipopolysaccharide export system protein LptA
MSHPLRLALFGVALAGLILAPELRAQAEPGQCNILENRRIERRIEAGVPMIYVTGPFLIRCPGGEELRALEGTVNEWTREILLTGNVFFQDPTRTLTAQEATYWANLGRLYATGNVVFTDRQEGSTIRGPELEYFRAMEGRPEPQVNAGQRPHLTLQPREASESAEPLEIDADRLSIIGQNDLSAYGNVIIRRSDLDATAGEAHYDGGAEVLDLQQNARIRSEEFDLTGETVRARMPDGGLEHVIARTDAALVGEELRVTAPELQLFISGELLQRAVARTGVDPQGNRTGRAIATARAFRLEGDSIDALTPGQRVDQVIAIGRARGESIDTTRSDAGPAPADSLAALVPADVDTIAATDTVTSRSAGVLAAIDRDWIVGDTIIGYFEYPTAPRDTAAIEDPAATEDLPAVGDDEQPDAELRRLVARGMAQSLYRTEPEAGSQSDRRGINYLAGETIELTFEEGELQVARVDGLRRGLYLDPLPTARDATTPEPTSAGPGSATGEGA